MLLAFRYRCFYVLTVIFMVNMYGLLQWQPSAWGLLIADILINTLYLFAASVLINLLALLVGSALGFSLTYALQVCLIFMLLLWHRRLPVPAGTAPQWPWLLFWLNPIPHLVLNWHSSANGLLNSQMQALAYPYPLYCSVLYMTVSAVLVEVGGYLAYSRHDLLTDTEGGGI